MYWNSRRSGFVYFLTNKNNEVLCVGVTNHLTRRIAEHKAKLYRGFTNKYNCDKLVYFEEYMLVSDAISREKQIKNWRREWKDKLVLAVNPDWEDLSETVGVNEFVIDEVKRYFEENKGG
jgi:putative endonuclease